MVLAFGLQSYSSRPFPTSVNINVYANKYTFISIRECPISLIISVEDCTKGKARFSYDFSINL